MDQILETIASIITSTISSWSYFGIVSLMTLESANIPIPSEIILPFSGFLAAQGTLDLNLVAWAGALGCTIGSVLSYGLGRWSDQTWIHRWSSGWGRIFITSEEIRRAEGWLMRYGTPVVFTSRLLPVVRTFISFPAGMAKVNLAKFIFYSFVGSLLWSYFLTWIGYVLGSNWTSLRPIFRQFDFLIVIALIIGIIWFIYRRGRKLAQPH